MQTSPLLEETTIVATSRNRAVQYRDKVYLRSRFDRTGHKTDSLHSMTWGELDERIRSLCKAMDNLGIEAFDRIAVFGPNTPRWIMATFSAMFLRGTPVPIYPSSKKGDVEWILHDSGARAVFCHGEEQLNKVLEVRDRLEVLEWTFVMDPTVRVEADRVLSFDDLLDMGRSEPDKEEKIRARLREVAGDDLAAIVYTSGTTGRPKGVMLTHTNFVSQRSISSSFDYSPGDIWFGHLPMCHVFGFSSDLLNSGFQAGELFVADTVEIDELRKNLADCRPTVMSSVPRLWEKLYVQINGIVAQRPAAVQRLFALALSVGKERFLRELEAKPLPLGLRLRSAAADRLFRKVKKQAGLERLRICHTGGGPINPDLIVFFGSMGIRLYQGFGLTETSPVTHTCTPKDQKLGWVGKPIPGTEHRIDADGELLIRGPQVMKGYWNNEQATREAITEDGFFRTGDIGEIDGEGYLRITDRKKEMIITSGGKNIAPQPIENAFNTDPYIEQVCVIGDNRNYLTALVVPNFPSLEAWAKEQGVFWKEREDLVRNEKVLALIQARIAKVNSTLARYETIKRFAVLTEEFSEESGALTPTLKKKRRVIGEKYRGTIESLYPPD
jgi:long-chain acyl-CoA synthetase